MARFRRRDDRKAKAGGRRKRLFAEEGKRLVLTPPEGVPLHLVVAGLGARLGAQIVDLVLTTFATFAIILALLFADLVGEAAFGAIATFVILALGTPFYIVCELLMNGRTPGKKLLGLRVVSNNGSGLSTHQIVVRNLTKEVEVFLPAAFLIGGGEESFWFNGMMLLWLVVVCAVPLRSAANRRIGDLVADTAVVLDPRPLLLPDVADAVGRAARERFVFSSGQLDLYGAYELQVLERLLRGGEEARDSRERQKGLARIGARIRAKIGYAERISPQEEEAFLKSFYVAQRAYLEQKKLMGEARADKFHREETTVENP
ncbi:RDD family protein [Jiella sonneratiae]|uniref:RDD family protein n=1 Tax=Jiella sonneratiae TaxID=2816856 RepID=A0ABS3J778_9HYPH|nr:RDD family protein [Jiella sonneratiae]MBO0905505.1 RDD family protein [Jiella sonneratiae]